MPPTPPPSGGNQTDYGTYGTTPTGGAYVAPGSQASKDSGGASQIGGSSSSSSSTGSTSSSGTGSVDYSQLFAAFGMPPSMIKQINNLMAQYISSGMDETTAYDNIIAQIRGGAIGANYQNGQSWYQTIYAGIQYGMATGLLDSSAPEGSYRDYVNAVNNFYLEYLGRDATTAEIIGYLQSGLSTTTVGAQLKGQSYANAYANSDANAMGYSWNALLGAYGNLPQGEKALTSGQELAIGESQTGFSTTLGDQLSKQLLTAQRRLETIFKGTLATPADLQKGGSGLKAPSLNTGPTGVTDTGPL